MVIGSVQSRPVEGKSSSDKSRGFSSYALIRANRGIRT